MKRLKWNEVAAIILLLFAVLITGVNVFGASVRMDFILQDTAYTTKFIMYYEDGTVRDSATTDSNSIGKDTTVAGIPDDTTIVFTLEYTWDSGFAESPWQRIRYAGAQGRRSYAVRRYTIDTSGTDDTISGVSITVTTATGSLLDVKLTNSEGWADFSLDSGETRWTATKGSAYSFNQLIDTITAADTGDITGQNTVIASPSNPDFATVYGNIRDNQGVKLEGVTVVATRPSGNVSDTANGIFYADIAVTKGSDTGYFFFELPRTNQYDDTTLGTYTFTGTYNGAQVFKIPNVTVPSSGNLDLGTIIAARKEN